MAEEKKKLSKNRLRAIIVASVSIVIGLILIILNIFIPVKYLASYIVIRNKGAKDGVMRVRYVDVGYGDCTIVELPDGKNMLIDGGDGRNVNEQRILKFLNKCGIDTIDYLVCTSINGEHCGGLYEILQYKTVKRIYMPYCNNVYLTSEYGNFVKAAHSSGAEILISEYGVGEANTEYNYFFAFLSPGVHTDESENSGYYALNTSPTQTNINNASAVMWLEYAGTSFLFTSDAEKDALDAVWTSYQICRYSGDAYCAIGEYSVCLEECNVVQVAAHGGENSACVAFYDFIAPEMAVISVGDNGNGCPSQPVLSDVINNVGNEQLYITERYGTVTIEVTVDGYGIV